VTLTRTQVQYDLANKHSTISCKQCMHHVFVLFTATEIVSCMHWAIVTTLPEAKPLKLVGCFSPQAKK